MSPGRGARSASTLTFVSSVVEEDLARVTVISPQRRVDLALPGSVTLGELLPSIVRFAGYDASNSTDAVHTWVLQRFGDDPLDPHKLVNTLGINDGETLHLRQRENAMPDAAFDDVVDAVATSTEQRPSWRQAHSQKMALGILVALLVGMPLLLLLRPFSADHLKSMGNLFAIGGTESLVAAASAGVLSLVCTIASISVSRAAGEYRVASAFSWAAVALGFIAGYGVFGEGTDLSLKFTVASAVTLLVASVNALASGVQVMGLFTTAVGAGLMLLTCAAMVIWPGHSLQVSAVAITVMVGITSLLPTFSYRLARIALPAVPPDAEAMMSDDTPVQSDIVARALLADRLLASFLVATCAVTLVLSVPVLLGRSWWGIGLCASIGLAMVLRARAFVGVQQRLALLVCGTLVLIFAFAFALLKLSPLIAMAVAGAVLTIAVLVLAYYAAVLYKQILAPTWGRTGDILEWVSIMTLMPVLLGVLDLYARFRSIGG